MAGQLTGVLSPLLQNRRLAAARSHLGRGRLLDFGCSAGALARFVEPARYLGVDTDQAALAQAQAHFPAHRFLTLDEFEASSTDEFDIVAALAVIEHLADPLAWLEKMRRRLTPRGRLVLTTPDPALQWAHEAGARVGLFSREAADEHQTLLDQQALRTLADRAGFQLTRYQRFLFGANQLCVLETTSR
ncbi:MAG: methyltransferase domain-containing protein [Luteitalea sp.]|nr:methyltransferase domain-containing protein [Luteitalea sp.]